MPPSRHDFFVMSRKLLVIFFFIIVFGLPIGWYLFLQVFGENRFDLPIMGSWGSECLSISSPALVIQSGAFDTELNLRDRVMDRMDEQLVIGQVIVECELEFPVYLVDKDGMIRGQYQLSRPEVDRLLAEVDVYLLNEKNGTEK